MSEKFRPRAAPGEPSASTSRRRRRDRGLSRLPGRTSSPATSTQHLSAHHHALDYVDRRATSAAASPALARAPRPPSSWCRSISDWRFPPPRSRGSCSRSSTKPAHVCLPHGSDAPWPWPRRRSCSRPPRYPRRPARLLLRHSTCDLGPNSAPSRAPDFASNRALGQSGLAPCSTSARRRSLLRLKPCGRANHSPLRSSIDDDSVPRLRGRTTSTCCRRDLAIGRFRSSADQSFE